MRFRDVVTLLERHGYEPLVLTGRDPRRRIVLAPRLVGRVMAMSGDGDDADTNGLIVEKQLAAGFDPLPGDVWNNFGGVHRLWFMPDGGPAGLMYPPGLDQRFQNFTVPAPMNTLSYALKSQSREHACEFAAKVEFENYSNRRIALEVTQQFTVLDACARLNDSSPHDLVGFEARINMRNLGPEAIRPRDDSAIALWVLSQYLSTPDTVLIAPLRTAADALCFDYWQYLSPDGVPARLWSLNERRLLAKADGQVTTKFDVLAHASTDCIASIELNTGRVTLIEFDFKPQAPYAAGYWNPWPGHRLAGPANSFFLLAGDCSQQAGPVFYEMETMSPALDLGSGETCTHSVRTWQCTLSKSDLATLCASTLHCTLDELTAFNANSQAS